MNNSKMLFSMLIATAGVSSVAKEKVQSTWEDVIGEDVVSVRPNFEPMIIHEDQQKSADEKIAEYVKNNNGKRPNILFYVMDDVGWGDLGCYGGGETLGAATPEMDTLAREGLRLTAAYSQPSSSPTRATILTGQLPVRHGILRPSSYGEEGGLNGLKVLPYYLKKAGYVTQAVGKWHVGENENSLPQNIGFDDFYGFTSVSNLYTEWRDSNLNPDLILNPKRVEKISDLASSKHVVHGKANQKLVNVREIDIEVSKTLDEDWANYSVNFLNEMKNSDKPFFLYHCTRGAHFDNYPSDKFIGKSAAKTPFRDTMVELDTHLGTLVETLRKNGQLEHTLIFITSDNGPEMETWPDSGYTPFRGSKGNCYEGGVRVPGIFYWKGMIEEGQVSDGLFDLADLFNTSLKIAGALDYVEKEQFIDGIDQTSFILNRNGLSNRQAIFYWLNNRFAGVRFGEYKMLYYTIDDAPSKTYNNGGFSGSLVYNPSPLLYNLYMDPKEEHSFLLKKAVYLTFGTEIIKRHVESLNKYPKRHELIIDLF